MTSGLLLAVAGVLVLTALASWAPAAFRKLGLFSIFYGGCVGGLCGWSLREASVPRRGTLFLAAVLTLAGLVAIAVHGAWRFREEQQAAANADPQQAMALNVLQAAADTDPEIAADLAARRQRMNPTFRDYLAVRTRALGEWQFPWPSAFWAAEIFVSAGAAMVVAHRLLTAQSRETARLLDQDTATP